MSIVKQLLHVLETIVYPDRWNIDYVTVQFNDGEKLEFEDPEYWGPFDSSFIVMPEDEEKQVRIERHSVKKTSVRIDNE